MDRSCRAARAGRILQADGGLRKLRSHHLRAFPKHQVDTVRLPKASVFGAANRITKFNFNDRRRHRSLKMWQHIQFLGHEG